MWLDHWELLPGDSLVQRIFEEGIDGADAVIVVISRNSLRSRWVNEELSAAVVKRINEGSRLIPIVLDHIPVDELPVALRHLVIEFVPDVDLLDHVLDRVQRSIFNIAIKPAVGTPPRRTPLRQRNTSPASIELTVSY